MNSGGGEFNSGNGDTVASTDRARTGSYSAKMSINTSGGGSHGTRLFRWKETQEHTENYLSAWYYFPQQFSAPDWWNIMQTKSKVSESQNDPFFTINVGNRAGGAMYLYLFRHENNQSYGQTSYNLPVGQWVHIEMYVKSGANNNGQIKVWQNGNLLWDLNNVNTRYTNGDVQWSVNNYSENVSPSPTIIYVDDARISIERVGP